MRVTGGEGGNELDEAAPGGGQLSVPDDIPGMQLAIDPRGIRGLGNAEGDGEVINFGVEPRIRAPNVGAVA